MSPGFLSLHRISICGYIHTILSLVTTWFSHGCQKKRTSPSFSNGDLGMIIHWPWGWFSLTISHHLWWWGPVSSSHLSSSGHIPVVRTLQHNGTLVIQLYLMAVWGDWGEGIFIIVPCVGKYIGMLFHHMILHLLVLTDLMFRKHLPTIFTLHHLLHVETFARCEKLEKSWRYFTITETNRTCPVYS